MKEFKAYTDTIWRVLDVNGNGHLVLLVKINSLFQVWHKMKLSGNMNFSSLRCETWDTRPICLTAPEETSPELAQHIAEKYIKCVVNQFLPDEEAFQRLQKIEVKSDDPKRVGEILNWLENTEFASIKPLDKKLV